MNAIGIMQGRLSPSPIGRAQSFPTTTWRAEFAHAADAGLSRIEWLVTADRYSENPLFSEQGIGSISLSIAESGVRVSTLCADFLIAQPLVRVAREEAVAAAARLSEVIVRSARIGVETIVVPILENGEIRINQEAAEIAKLLGPIAAMAAANGQRLAIESQLPVVEAQRLIDQCQSPAVGVCYDLGNAAAIGADCAADIRELGASLFEIHIKDRVRNGGTVELGKGAVDFANAFLALVDVGYDGPLILETPVGVDPFASARRHRTFVQQYLRPSAIPVA